MSKKIIAIALFATMVLSMFTVSANAAWFTSNSSEVIEVYAYNKEFNTTSNTTVDYGNDKLSGIPNPTASITSASEKETVLKGPFKEFSKSVVDFYADKMPIYLVEFILPGYDGSLETDTNVSFPSFTGEDGSVKPEKFTSGPNKDEWGFRYEFTLKSGGNQQTIKLSYKDSRGRIINFEHTIKYTDTSKSGKPEKGLVVVPKSTPYTDGDYNAYVLGGVLFIDVAKDVVDEFNLTSGNRNLPYHKVNNDPVGYGPAVAPLGFEFYTEDGTRIPAKGRTAYVVEGDNTTTGSDKLFAIGAYNVGSNNIYKEQIKSDATFKMPINLAYADGDMPKTFKISIEDDQYLYTTTAIQVRFRTVPRNIITNVVIEQGRDITIEVEETIELSIASAFRTTYTKLTLGDNNQQTNLLIDGMKLTGLKPGKVDVYVYADAFKTQVIDTINVTVVAKGSTATPTPSANENYRVVVKGSLNVRSGPGTSYAIVGKLSQNAIVEVVSITDGWALLSNGTYVSAAYLVKVSSGTGNAITTASNLNVREGPGTSYKIVTKYPYGTSVNIVGYSADGKWAQLDNGYWVSVQYVK